MRLSRSSLAVIFGIQYFWFETAKQISGSRVCAKSTRLQKLPFYTLGARCQDIPEGSNIFSITVSFCEKKFSYFFLRLCILATDMRHIHATGFFAVHISHISTVLPFSNKSILFQPNFVTADNYENGKIKWNAFAKR